MILTPTRRAWLVDTAERTGSTFVQAFLGSLSLDALLSLAGQHPDLGALRIAEQAGLSAVLALVKAALAARVGGTVSPASLAPEQPPGQAQLEAPSPIDDAAISDAFYQGQAEVLGRQPHVTRRYLHERQEIGRRLGRHVHHDERSRAYGADASAVLRTVLHRHYGPVLDQGDLGSCTGNALAQALNTVPLHRSGRLLREADAVRLYGAATVLDDQTGTYPPDDTGSDGLDVCKAAVAAGIISRYAHAFGLDQLLAALVLQPVIVGTVWTAGMDTPDAAGYLHPQQGATRGGHEYVLLGLDVRRQDVTMLNSWGDGWGHSGTARIRWDDLRWLLEQQGDCTVPIR